MGIKRALTVGINYPGQSSELRGCVNDSHTIVKLLRDKFGFGHIIQVLDNDATTDRIKQELSNLINGSKPGDVLFFHYSGHGTQMIDDEDADYEPDGLDEVICPVDFNWRDKVIRDDDLKAIFDTVPNGVNLTVFLDCCNSGGGMDSLNEYQADTGETPAGGRYLEPPAEIKAKIEESRLAPKPRMLSRQIDQTGMLISGCRSDQTSADAKINGLFQGATTYFLQAAITELGTDASYVEIVDMLNHFMVTNGFSQRPQLDGPVSLHSRAFLSEYDFGDPEAVAVVEYVVVEEPVEEVVADEPTHNVTIDSSTTVNVGNPEPVAPKPPKKKDDDDDKKKKMLMIGGAVLALAAAAFFIM